MFEREIKFITDFSLNNIKKLGSFFTLENLANARVHPAITQYISAEIDYLIYLDRQRLLQKSDFDYSGPETAKHFEAIAAEIKKNKLIPFEDVKMRVQRAVNFNVNFLLRPHWTLRKFIFDPDESRSSEEVRLLMNYSWFYEYYKQYFQRVIERKKILSLSKNEFSERFIVFRKELVSSQFELFIDDALTSLAEFLNMGESIKDRLATGAVEAFLKDSDLSDHAMKLRQQLSSDTKQKYSIADIKEALLSSIPAVRTIEISEDEVDSQNDEETSIESLLLETQPPAEAEDIPVEPVEPEEEESSRDASESELDVSIQITELLTTQLLGDDSPKMPSESEPSKSFDGVPAESIIAEIKAAQEALAAVTAKSKEEPEPVEESIPEPEEDQVDADADFMPEETDAPEAEEPADSEDGNAFVGINGDELEFGEPDNDPILTSAISDEIADENNAESIHLHLPDDDEVIADIEETAKAEDETADETNAPDTNEIVQGEAAKQEEPAEEEEEPEEEESELFRYFTTKETMRIIGSVFANDQIDFVNTIERVAACNTFDQAQLILTSVFYSYRVNPLTSKEARLLEDRVQKFMEEREQ